MLFCTLRNKYWRNILEWSFLDEQTQPHGSLFLIQGISRHNATLKTDEWILVNNARTDFRVPPAHRKNETIPYRHLFLKSALHPRLLGNHGGCTEELYVLVEEYLQVLWQTKPPDAEFFWTLCVLMSTAILNLNLKSKIIQLCQTGRLLHQNFSIPFDLLHKM